MERVVVNALEDITAASPLEIFAFGDHSHRLRRLRRGYAPKGEPIHLLLIEAPQDFS